MTKEFAQGALSRLLTVADKATEFMVAEIPPTLEQLLNWKMAENLVTVFVCLLGAGFVYRYIKFAVAINFEKGPDTPQQLIGLIVGAIASLIITIESLCNIFSSVQNVLQIWLAPRIYLIEYLREFTK